MPRNSSSASDPVPTKLCAVPQTENRCITDWSPHSNCSGWYKQGDDSNKPFQASHLFQLVSPVNAEKETEVWRCLTASCHSARPGYKKGAWQKLSPLLARICHSGAECMKSGVLQFLLIKIKIKSSSSPPPLRAVSDIHGVCVSYGTIRHGEVQIFLWKGSGEMLS